MSFSLIALLMASLYATELKPLETGCDLSQIDDYIKDYSIDLKDGTTIKLYEVDNGRPAADYAHLVMTISQTQNNKKVCYMWESKSRFVYVKSIKGETDKKIVARVIVNDLLVAQSAEMSKKEATLTFQYEINKDGKLSLNIKEQMTSCDDPDFQEKPTDPNEQQVLYISVRGSDKKNKRLLIEKLRKEGYDANEDESPDSIYMLISHDQIFKLFQTHVIYENVPSSAGNSPCSFVSVPTLKNEVIPSRYKNLIDHIYFDPQRD